MARHPLRFDAFTAFIAAARDVFGPSILATLPTSQLGELIDAQPASRIEHGVHR